MNLIHMTLLTSTAVGLALNNPDVAAPTVTWDSDQITFDDDTVTWDAG